MQTISLRKATIEDLATLTYWDSKQHVIEAGSDDDWNWEEELLRDTPWRNQLIAELDGKPIGFVQIIDPHEEETHYWGEIDPHKRAIDIWIGEEEHLGKGYGSQMMTLALDLCFEDPSVTEVVIDPLASNTAAIRFYKRLGFVHKEFRTFDEDYTEVLGIQRHMWYDKRC